MPNRVAPTIEQVDVGDMILAQRKDGQRIICAGSRDWTDLEKIRDVLLAYDKKLRIDYVIHGNNGYDANGRSLDQLDNNESDLRAVKGADKLAGQAAIRFYIPVLRYIPDWKNLGRKAGMVRNRQMIVNGMPTCAILFHDDIQSSKGTKDLMWQLEEFGIPYEIVTH